MAARWPLLLLLLLTVATVRSRLHSATSNNHLLTSPKRLASKASSNGAISSKKELSTLTSTEKPLDDDDGDIYDDEDDDDDYDDDDLIYDEEDYDDYYEDDEYEDISYDTDKTGCPTPFLGRCQCGMTNYLNQLKYVVNCSNAGFTNASMLRALPEETQVLIFTGNYIEVLPTNIFGTVADLPDLETIDMSNNGIEEIKGKTYHRVSNVKTLILNHNKLYIVDSKHHPRVFSNFKNLENLHLTNAFTEEVDSDWYMVSLEIIFQGSRLTRLKKLYLEQNEIWTLRDYRTFCHLPTLEHLYLGSNRLSGLPMDLTCMQHLQHLDLEYNSIRRLDANATAQLDRLAARHSAFSVRLTGNPFFCDCHIRPFYRWLQTTRVRLLDSERYVCFAGRPAQNENVPLLQLRETECPAVSPGLSRRSGGGGGVGSTALVVLAVLASLLLVVVLALIHRRRLTAAVQSVARARQYTNIERQPPSGEQDV